MNRRETEVNLNLTNKWNYRNRIYTTYHHSLHKSRVSCQKGPTSRAYAWQIGPFGRIPSKCDTLVYISVSAILTLRVEQDYHAPSIGHCGGHMFCFQWEFNCTFQFPPSVCVNLCAVECDFDYFIMIRETDNFQGRIGVWRVTWYTPPDLSGYSLIVVLWRHTVSKLVVNIATGNDLSSNWLQTLPEQILIRNWIPDNKIMWNVNKIPIQEDIYENIVCILAAFQVSMPYLNGHLT